MANEKARIEIELGNGKKAGETLNELVATSVKLNREIKNLKPGTEEFVQKSQDLQKVNARVGDVRKQINGAKAASDQWKQSFLNIIPFGNQFKALAGQVTGVTQGVGGLSTASGVLRKAMLAIPILAIIAAITTLVSWFTSTQEGMDKVTSVTRPLLAIFEKMKGVIQELGGSVFKGLSQILNGDFKEGLKTLGSGFVDAIGNTRKAIDEGWEAGKRLDELQKQIEQTEINLTRQRAILNEEYQKSKEIAQDLSRSDTERLKAARAAQNAQNELLNIEQGFLDLKIEKRKLEHSLNDTSRADELELAKLEAERTEFAATAAKKRASAKALENTVIQQAAAEQKRIDAEEQKAKDAALKQEVQIRQSIEDLKIEVIKDGIEREIAEINLSTQRKIEALVGSETQIAEQRVLLEEAAALRIQEVKDKAAAEAEKTAKKLSDEEIKAAADAAKAKEEIAKEEHAIKSDFLGLGAELLGEDEEQRRKNADAIKAFSVAKILSDLEEEIAGYFKHPASTGTLGAVGTAKAIFATLRAGVAIRRVQKQKFAYGGVLTGPSHAQGGIKTPYGEFEGDEIILAKGVYRNPSLRRMASNLNVAGGGRKFEAGGPLNPFDNSRPPIGRNDALGGLSGTDDRIAKLESAFLTYAEKVDTWAKELRVTSNLQDTRKGLNVLDQLKNDADV